VGAAERAALGGAVARLNAHCTTTSLICIAGTMSV
jgi:hypothetical protein